MRKFLNGWIIIILLCSCMEKEYIRNDFSIIPSSSLGRDNIDLGTIFISNNNVTIDVWDHGLIDGDIVSIYVNGKLYIDEVELDDYQNKISFNVNLDYKGYNYVLLYAHNEGSISPNTCAINISDGVESESFILESNLLSNGAVNVVVD